MLEVDIPDVLAELEATFEAYERALTGNDIETLGRSLGRDVSRWGKRASNRAIGSKAGRRSHAIDHGWNARVRTASRALRTMMQSAVSNRGADDWPRIQPHHRSATGCHP